MDLSIENIISELYNDDSYLSRYSSDLYLALVFVIIVLFLFIYFFLKLNRTYYKKYWYKYKCQPFIIPFAGFINKPDNQTIYEYTISNYNNCINTILNQNTTKNISYKNITENFASRKSSAKLNLTNYKKIANSNSITDTMHGIQNLEQSHFNNMLAYIESIAMGYVGVGAGTIESKLVTVIGLLFAVTLVIIAVIIIIVVIGILLIPMAAVAFGLSWIPLVGIIFFLGGIALLVVSNLAVIVSILLGIANHIIKLIPSGLSNILRKDIWKITKELHV